MINVATKHLQIYRHIFATTLQQSMEYRWNFFIQLLYGPAYITVQYLLLRVAYFQTPVLVGWDFQQGMLLFAVFQFIYTIGFMLFVAPIRDLLVSGIRRGELDFYLTKPLNTQFVATFSPPSVDQIALVAGIIVMLGWYLVVNSAQFTLLSALAFAVTLASGFVVLYGSLVFYSSLGFFVTRGRQILEIYNKVSDYAQYPIPLFPQALGVFFFTLVPTAFYSYIPAAILVQKLSPIWALVSLLAAAGCFVASRWSWQRGIRAYSSASS